MTPIAFRRTFGRRFVRRFAAGVLAALGLAGAAAAQADPPASLAPFDAALLEFEQCHWPQAFERFAALADTVHPQAARIALLMQAHGPRLFAGRHAASAEQRAHWLDLAAASLPLLEAQPGLASASANAASNRSAASN